VARLASYQVLSIRSAPLPCPCISSTELYSLPASRPVHARALRSHANPSSGSLLPWGSRPSGFGPSRQSNSDPSSGGLGPPAPVCGAGFEIGAMSWAGPDEILLSTSLAGFLDKKLIVLLRDGRKLLGTLCSFDQFANVVLQGACERVIVGEQYCDVPLGLYVIRGENVVLIGELVMTSVALESGHGKTHISMLML
jgi:U6 snRNA-associated Sm-like protein LSm1